MPERLSLAYQGVIDPTEKPIFDPSIIMYYTTFSNYTCQAMLTILIDAILVGEFYASARIQAVSYLSIFYGVNPKRKRSKNSAT